MSAQFSIAVRNAVLDAIETAIGVGAMMRIYSGAAPLSCSASRTGVLLCELTMPADWMLPAAGGVKVSSTPWVGQGIAAGVAGYYSIQVGAVCHEQGSVTGLGGGGELTLDSTTIALLQTVTVTQKVLTAPNA